MHALNHSFVHSLARVCLSATCRAAIKTRPPPPPLIIAAAQQQSLWLHLFTSIGRTDGRTRDATATAGPCLVAIRSDTLRDYMAEEFIAFAAAAVSSF